MIFDHNEVAALVRDIDACITYQSQQPSTGNNADRLCVAAKKAAQEAEKVRRSR